MAQNVFFKKGLLANLPSSYAAGTFYVTTDERAMYLDIDDSTRIRLGDFIQVDAVANLPTDGASTSALYYCVAENILAKWNGSTWTQINKQPTAEEMKTLLGLGSLAYKSEVVEGDLNAALVEKINASAEGNHAHSNKDVLDGITAEKVAAWDASEQNAKDYADGLNTAMNTRVEALEAIDHEHANKALLDTYTQTEADLADAVAKKHAHTFNETELNKIAEGDVAKWNGVAADHLTSEDKTALENAIKEAKKAGTDANTNIEAYKVTNDARVLAVEEDVAEITDGTNGILAQAKAYSDGKLATARTEITAEIDADVKVVADELTAYKTSNDAAVAAKVAQSEYDADKATFATKTELGDVDAKFANYVTSASYATDKAGIEKAIEDEAKARSDADADFETRIAALEGNFGDGEGTVEAQIAAAVAAEAEIARAAEKANADDIDTLEGKMTTAEGKISALETASATHATKDELNAVDAKFADYKTAEAQKAIDDEQDRRLGVIEGDYLKAADIANFETKENVKKVADDLAAYVESNDAALADVKATADAAAVKTEVEAALALKADKSVVDAMYTNAKIDELIAGEKSRAEGIEGGLRTDVDAIKADYLKAADKTELEGKITAEETRAKGVEESLQTQINTIMNNPDTEGVINSINEFTQYIADHGEIAEGFRADIDKNKEDIAANAQAIADETTRATGAEEALGGRIDELKASYDEHTHSWDDLTDKPFGETAAHDTITFELTDDVFENGVWTSDRRYVKVSDEVFSIEELRGCDIEYFSSYGGGSIGNVQPFTTVYGTISADAMVIVIPSTDIAIAAGYGEVPAGTYFSVDSDRYTNVLKFKSEIKTLDDKFISANIARVEDVNAVNEALSGRVDTLEAIDHEAYVAADATLKSELQGEIAAAKTEAANQDAVILAEAQAYADQAEADAIAAAEGKVNALAATVYTKEEVDAAVAAAVNAATQWGEF